MLKRQGMEDELERIFTAPDEKTKRYNYLASVLDDGGGYDGFFHDFRQVAKCWMDWKRSGYVVRPFPGGRLDNPESWNHDIDAMELREEFYMLKAKMKSDSPTFNKGVL